MARFIADALCRGRKVLFPTNRSKVRDRILAEVRKAPGVQLHEQVFSRPLHEEERNVEIRQESAVNASTNVLCCTTYLGVGLDIYDPNVWDVVVLSEWTGAQIIQFANRLRSKDLYITCFYSDKPHQYGDCAFEREQELRRNLQTANGLKYDGTEDPIIYKTITNKPWLRWDYSLGGFVFDEVHRDVYLDWCDYQDFHSALPQVQADMEAAGYEIEVNNVDKLQQDKIENTKRNSHLSEENNALLAAGMVNLMGHNPE